MYGLAQFNSDSAQLEQISKASAAHIQPHKMMFKYSSLLALIAVIVVSAAPHGHDHGHGATSHAAFHLVSEHGHEHEHGHGHDHGHDHGGKYHFSYGVDDHKTGDHHSQSEKRDGHKVEGHYELLDADGHKRIVHYTADEHSGFHATVERVPTHHKPQESHTSHHGGHVIKFSEDHTESHGHGHHGHGHSEDGYEIKQDHGQTVHHHEHHGHY